MVTALVFNPNPNIGLLAASYLDGELVLLDPFNDQELEGFRADCHTLAVSPNGRLLAGAAGGGTIQIYEFDSLKLLYRVRSSNLYIKQLAFSRDSLHFSDIRGSHCNVWEPAVLLRDSIGDESSDGTPSSIIDVFASQTKVKISVMILHTEGEIVLCGKDDGSVTSYNLKSAAELRMLYQHKSLVRILVCWPQNNLLLSVDVSNRILIWKLKQHQAEGWTADRLILQSRLDCAKSITNVLPGEATGHFVLSTRDSDHFWSIKSQQEEERIYSDGQRVRKWIQHPQSPIHMICIDGAVARIFIWQDWSEVVSVPLTPDLAHLRLKTVTPYMSVDQRRILFEMSESDGSPKTRGLYLLDAASFSLENLPINQAIFEAAKGGGISEKLPVTAEGAVPVLITLFDSQLATLAQHVAHVIGLSNTNQLIFLNTHSWVCSIDLKSLVGNSVSYSRHFFVPYDWFAGTRDIICAVSQRDVLFAHNNDVAIIRGGLEYVENVELEVCDTTELSDRLS